MYKTVSTALHSKWIKLVVPVFILATLAFAGYKNFRSIELFSWDMVSDHAALLTLIFSFTFLNLYFEMRKWEVLVNSPLLTKSKAFSAVLVGMSSGFVTPNRLGEFAGRALVLPKEIRKKGSLMTFAGAGVQGMVTFVAGIGGLWFYPVIPQLKVYAELTPKVFYGALIIFIGVIVFLWFKKPLQSHLSSVVKHFKSLKPIIISKALIWALGRYVIFSTQFALALYALGFTGDIWLCYSGIFLLYFLQSYMPFTSLGELGVREVLAIIILGPYMEEPLLAALASFVIWLSNIGVPVLIGLIQIKFAKHELFGNN